MSISYDDGFLTRCQMTPVRPLHWVLELSRLLESYFTFCLNIGGLNECEVQISQDFYEQACLDLFRLFRLEMFRCFGLKNLCRCYRLLKNTYIINL